MFETQNDLTWIFGNIMPNNNNGLAGASAGTKVYMCGGYSTVNSRQTRIYDTITGVWSVGNEMVYPDYFMAGAGVGTKIYMCNAESKDNYKILTTDDDVSYDNETVVKTTLEYWQRCSLEVTLKQK